MPCCADPSTPEHLTVPQGTTHQDARGQCLQRYPLASELQKLASNEDSCKSDLFIKKVFQEISVREWKSRIGKGRRLGKGAEGGLDSHWGLKEQWRSHARRLRIYITPRYPGLCVPSTKSYRCELSGCLQAVHRETVYTKKSRIQGIQATHRCISNGWKREMGECYAAVRSNRLSTAHTATEHEAP